MQKTMQTWVSHTAGGPETLVLETHTVPVPADGELLIKVQAVGVNFPDSLLIRDLYQVKPPRPLVPGSELCGVVQALGPGVTEFQCGDVVIGRCGWGALSEYAVLAQQRCIRMPASLPAAEASAFLFTYATAYHALVDSGKLQAGQTLLVLGAAGGVGSAAVQVGSALGATVLAAASSQIKLEFAQSLGASHGLVYDPALEVGEGQKALAAELKMLAPQGVDVVLDPVGGAYSEPALRTLSRGGRHLVVGFTAGIPRVPLNLTLLRRSQIIGVDWRLFVQEQPEANARNLEALLDLWQRGLIHPQVTERYHFEEAPNAIGRLEARDALGKIVIEMPA